MTILKEKKVIINSNTYLVFDNSTGENKISLYLKSSDKEYPEFKLNQGEIDILAIELIRIIDTIDEEHMGYLRPTMRLKLNENTFIFTQLDGDTMIETLINLIDTISDLYHGYEEFVEYYFDSYHVFTRTKSVEFKEKLDKLRSLGNN